LACHIAEGYSGILDSLVKPIAEGQEGPRFSQEDLAQWNAAAAEANAAQPKLVRCPSVGTRDGRGGHRARPDRAPRGHLASMQAATA
jgi:hypothetical protein